MDNYILHVTNAIGITFKSLNGNLSPYVVLCTPSHIYYSKVPCNNIGLVIYVHHKHFNIQGYPVSTQVWHLYRVHTYVCA